MVAVRDYVRVERGAPPSAHGTEGAPTARGAGEGGCDGDGQRRRSGWKGRVGWGRHLRAGAFRQPEDVRSGTQGLREEARLTQKQFAPLVRYSLAYIATTLAEDASKIHTGNAPRTMTTIGLAHFVGRRNQATAANHCRSHHDHALDLITPIN